MCLSYGISIGRIRDEHPGANYILGSPTYLCQSLEHDFDAPTRLGRRIGIHLAIRPDGGSACHEDSIACTDGPAEPVDRLVGAAR